MNKFLTFSIKTIINPTFVCAAIYSLGNRKMPEILLAVILGLYNTLILIYFYIKRIEYTKRFLRKLYNPSSNFLLSVIAVEAILGISFYALTCKYLIGLFHLILSSLLDVLLIYDQAKVHSVKLEKSAEFFKIGFLKNDHIVNGIRCLNKGEVVQILDRSGSEVIIRKSDGRVFTLHSHDIDDTVDIVL